MKRNKLQRSYSNKFKRTYSVKRKRNLMKNGVFRFGLLLTILVLGVSYLLFLSPVFQIKTIKISGNQQIPSNSILATIRSKMSRDNIFLFGPGAVGSAFLKAFPQAEKIELQRSFPDTLNVKIDERQPVALFCQGNNCSDIDKTGTIFYSQAATSGLPEITSQIATDSLAAGEQALDPTIVSQIQKINFLLAGLQIQATQFAVVSEQRLNVTTSEGWQIYFNLQGDVNWQITELSAVLNDKIPPQKRSSLQYIDLRFDKVFIYPAVN